ncbi:MAG: 50S ribosomal protein L15 [Chitinophagales bacterium]|nr:50S ribosomal protein L15 [Chitinophagales bacterium]MCO5280912.1 50S ribosomal protein L15 [Chitinophagales bacterium]OJV27541.1 MAG: 50S ribosomal protein L15 [Bacteroidetes bacterium 37-13]HRN93301.1 50S ribosomal protein L15 [Chitinophagales bacterium]HRP39636.1 50S ribosomal protein L15 [Chitinophagales bacterium]
MELYNLAPATGATKTKKRLGRGQGSTTGGTAGRGHKGAQSRSGYKAKKGHEGGQMPLQRRLPKFGFKNPFRVEYNQLNLGKIQQLVEKFNLTEITVESLRTSRQLGKTELVKVLGNGELTSKVNVSVHAISESAKQKIEALGGTVTIVK